MSYGVKLKIWGDYACFTRPEMKVERVSYDVITPSAARGILEAIYWKPTIRWVVDRIHVLNKIKFDNVRRNELSGKVPVGTVNKAIKDGVSPVEVFINKDRQQRASLVLRNVAYVIEAHFEFTGDEDNNPAKYKETFDRRAKKGQCFTQPYLGCREFSAAFELVEGEVEKSFYSGEERDIGWMLHDIDYENDMTAKFFKSVMKDGVIEVQPFNGKGVIG